MNNMNNMRNILAVASFEQGRGTGHLVRSAALVTELRARGFNALLCILGDRSEEEAAKVVPGFDFHNSIPLIGINDMEDTPWDLIVTDRYRTLPEESPIYHGLAPVLGIDEGGVRRPHFDFLLDILHCGGIPANERRPDLVTGNVAASRRERLGLSDPIKLLYPPHPLDVLVSFGGEDAAGLGQKTWRALLGRGDIKLTVASPSNPIPGLAAHLADFDLVITHYGITAYESLAAGVPVLLEHPGNIHRTLAKKAGFWPLGGLWELVRLPDGEAPRWVAEVLSPRCEALAIKLGLTIEKKETLADYIASLSPRVRRECPLCGGPKGRIIARFPKRTYRACPQCGITYMDRLDRPSVEYAEDYFFDSYKRQYGKTYIEDFDNLKAMARGRIGHIRQILRNEAAKELAPEREAGPGSRAAPLSAREILPPEKLLDIGCAYGPFLQAAKEAGFFMTVGFDPAQSAVQYLKEQLRVFALQGFFPEDCRIGPAETSFWEAGYFDVVTMWYVIEHIPAVREALKTAAALLKQGGVFAFSTPSCGGISGRKSRRMFLEKSPADHWTVWNPRQVKQQLGRMGFEVKRIVITGHHPKRFPRWMRFLGNSILLKISRTFGLGDTFEVYAVKR
jgi:2-polyprenyl-3-methyl-5-hydroxy-6-metoxy-1,4-benzoquinol methylase